MFPDDVTLCMGMNVPGGVDQLLCSVEKAEQNSCSALQSRGG